jgi:5-formyltetrahydrofolate cyclo-ligase
VDAVDAEKQKLRRQFREIRRAIPAQSRAYKSKLIQKKLLESEFFQHAKSVMCYFETEYEVSNQLVRKESLRLNKKLYTPAITGKEMIAVPTSQTSLIEENRFKVREVNISEALEYERHQIDLIIVPGLAFTNNGDRLGSGKGYYDKFLAQYPLSVTTGFCFAEQLIANLPVKKYDIAVEYLFYE